jgi:hypothetical protein
VQDILQQQTRLLQADQRESATRLDLHGDVNVAVYAVLAAGYRAEDREVAHPAPA